MKYYIIYGFQSSGTRYLQQIFETIGLGTSSFIHNVASGKREDIDKYFKENIRNNVWGTRIHGHTDITKTLQKIYPNEDIFSDLMSFLNRLCPGVKFIYLTRLNKLQHAISWKRALNIGKSLEATGDAPEDYSNEEILKMMNSFNVHESFTRDFFTKNNIKPLYITYEELCDDNVGVARRVLNFLEIHEKRDLGKIIRNTNFPQRIHCDVRDKLYCRMQKFLLMQGD